MGLMYELEELSTLETSQLIRLTHFQQFYIPITNSLNLYTIFYYQPDIVSFNDYRILLENRFVFKLTNRLKYSLTFDFDYDSVVDDSLSSYDMSVKQFISFQF